MTSYAIPTPSAQPRRAATLNDFRVRSTASAVADATARRSPLLMGLGGLMLAAGLGVGAYVYFDRDHAPTQPVNAAAQTTAPAPDKFAAGSAAMMNAPAAAVPAVPMPMPMPGKRDAAATRDASSSSSAVMKEDSEPTRGAISKRSVRDSARTEAATKSAAVKPKALMPAMPSAKPNPGVATDSGGGGASSRPTVTSPVPMDSSKSTDSPKATDSPPTPSSLSGASPAVTLAPVTPAVIVPPPVAPATAVAPSSSTPPSGSTETSGSDAPKARTSGSNEPPTV